MRPGSLNQDWHSKLAAANLDSAKQHTSLLSWETDCLAMPTKAQRSRDSSHICHIDGLQFQCDLQLWFSSMNAHVNTRYGKYTLPALDSACSCKVNNTRYLWYLGQSYTTNPAFSSSSCSCSCVVMTHAFLLWVQTWSKMLLSNLLRASCLKVPLLK